jgi:pyruvate/2-oxoglutarate dehydrogenase complex dihydrolipoamide dehydrogenase (E3) component
VTGEVKVDFGKVMERMRKIRAEISENDSVERFHKFLGVDTFLGEAKFVGKN